MIHLFDNYYLDADENQLILINMGINKKSGEQYPKRTRYYRTIESLLDAIKRDEIRFAVRDSDTAQALVDALSFRAVVLDDICQTVSQAVDSLREQK